jgi:hypothetical protein
MPPPPRPTRKKVPWHSTFGRIVVTEAQLRLGRRGARLRPFCQQAQVHTRGYSTLLQRVLTGFGAEAAFGQIPARVWEHYGIQLPASSARMLTLRHAPQAGAHRTVATDPAAATVLAECDGSLIPIVENAVLARPARRGIGGGSGAGAGAADAGGGIADAGARRASLS